MKKKIQKYLAGEREGFSLVELIIVIAIMAILIGVIALAVIPNIQRSRESKDLSFLDSVASAANAAIANAKVTGENTLHVYEIGTGDDAGKLKDKDTDDISKVIRSTLAQNPSIGSGQAQSGATVDVYYNVPTNGAANITVRIADSSGKAIACKYLTDPSVFEVKN